MTSCDLHAVPREAMFPSWGSPQVLNHCCEKSSMLVLSLSAVSSIGSPNELSLSHAPQVVNHALVNVLKQLSSLTWNAESIFKEIEVESSIFTQ